MTTTDARPTGQRGPDGPDVPGQTPRPEQQRGFRGDVQGLRAIAVLTVIAGHAGVPWVPGGFVGVDVFFVISGFLISHLLYREVERDGQVSLRDFYARRARRILPAATVVTVVTVVATLLWTSALDALSTVTDALWATFFAANIRFASVGTDYFAADQAPSPLQHYWSLAVEEQFYVVWPLLLIGTVWLWRRARRGRHTAEGLPRGAVLGVLLVVGVASFVFGVLYTASSPSAAYFSTPARAWELAVGALTALVAARVAGRMPGWARGGLALAGLAAIAVACLTYGEGTPPFPGVGAALPVLGSAAVLLAGAGPSGSETWVQRALGVGPMRVVGDWSYSLYLWHWPLLTIPLVRGYTEGGSLSVTEATAAVSATFVLAALTYRYVETPFRDSRRVPRPRALALYPTSVVLVVVVCVAGNLWGNSRIGGDGDEITVAGSGVESSGVRLSEDDTIALVQASVYAARQGEELPATLRPALTDLRDDIPDVAPCDYKDDTVRDLCPRGDPDADRTLVVLGNSHGRMWIPAFERIAEQAGWRTYYLVKPNCTAADLLVSDLDNNNAPWTACSDFREWAIDQIDALHPDLTVLASSGPNPVIYTDDGRAVRQADPDRMTVTQDGWESSFERIAPLTDRVVLLRDVPKNPEDPGPCLTGSDVDLGTCAFTPLPEQEADSDASVAAAEATGTEHLNPGKWVCWDDTCPMVVGDTITYRDRGHLTATYAGDLADEIGRALDLL